MEWTVKELAERAGISGRTLRHYHRLGLVEPDRIGSNGYRYYGPDAVARLQRVLLLRDTGMSLPQIATTLEPSATHHSEIEALKAHLDRLTEDRETLDRRMDAVRHTLRMRHEGREPEMDMMLDGFNDRYEDEVVRRWGREAFDASYQWWHAKSVAQQRAWRDRAEALLADWATLHEAGHRADSATAQSQAAVHLAWFAEIPGTPAHAGDAEQAAAMVHGVAGTYESNPDSHRAFGSSEAATFAADALRFHVR